MLFLFKMQTPLISKSTLSTIETYLDKQTVMLEIGSGNSTAYFSKLVKKLYSLENNTQWFDEVNKQIVNQDNITYTLKISNLKNYDQSTPGKNQTYEMFKDYLDYIELSNFGEKKLDIIFNDGQARRICNLKAFDILKDNGYLIIHDFFNTPNLNIEWNLRILLKYYKIVEYDNKCFHKKKGVERGNDYIILAKKKKVNIDTNDLIDVSMINQSTHNKLNSFFQTSKFNIILRLSIIKRIFVGYRK